MKITEYVTELTKKEAGKKQVDVAQVAELVKLINKDFGGFLYFLIRLRKGKKCAC